VQDKNGRNAVFTPFTVPCNINFERMAEEDFEQYWYEILPDTFAKLAKRDPKAYRGTWNLWQEGIDKGLMMPQFHGREHFNLKVFRQKLAQRDSEVLTALKNRSYTSISDSGVPHVGYTAAFAFEKKEDIKEFPSILQSGTDAFEDIFGFRSKCFTPPAQQFPASLEKTLTEYGIRHYDQPFTRRRHQGNGKYKREFNILKRDTHLGLNILVRNVVFEPTYDKNALKKALQQIKAAFFWNKPAIISSHRVNFCGHIDPANREKGLRALGQLLNEIVSRWPQVEFITADELGRIIEKDTIKNV
jgi:hypothetical protein